MRLCLQGARSRLRLFRILPGGHVARLGIEEEGARIKPLRLHRWSQLGDDLGGRAADLSNHCQLGNGMHKGPQFVNRSHWRVQVAHTVRFLANVNNCLLIFLRGLSRDLCIYFELSSVAKPTDVFVRDLVRSQDWDFWDQPFCNNIRTASFARISRQLDAFFFLGQAGRLLGRFFRFQVEDDDTEAPL